MAGSILARCGTDIGVGNDKYGSVVTTLGTLDNPLGSGDPQDVSVSPNPDPGVNPTYPSYGYMGGGPVYQVPAGMTGAGNLLATYHAELPDDALYAALGLAASSDNGLHWTDLGEIIRLNQAYAVGLDGFEIGDGPLVLSPDGKYFYLYFPDWIANGTLHTATPTGVSTTTNVSVARALAASVQLSPPEATAEEKREQSTIAPAAEGGSVFRAQQLLALLCRQPISDTHSQQPDTLHAAYACRRIWAEQTAIGCFIRQPAYRRQSQVYGRRGVRVLFECDSVPGDHGPVEGQPGLGAVRVDAFTNGMVVRTL